MNNLKTVLLLLPVLLAGCRIYLYDTAGPMADYYYVNPDKDLSAIGKVALVELDNNSSHPQISTDATEAIFQSLQKKQLFSTTIVGQDAPSWRSLQLDLNSTYTPEQLSEIRKTLRCDAVLIGTITEFKPYPHMAIGLRLKLIDLKDGQLLWALEQIWDTADKTTEYRIRRYFHTQMRSGFAPLRERLAVVSSLRFLKFVSYEVGETLQRGA